MQYYQELDIVITPLYFLLILVIAYSIRLKNRDNPFYKFFLPGLIVKLIGALALCLIYTHYYGYGGDTIGYHESAKALVNLASKNFFNFLHVWLGESSRENLNFFDSETGYPHYLHDPHAFSVVRFIVPFEFITLKSFSATALLTAVLGFIGLWKLFLLFCEFYPSLYKQFAFSVFFIPSVVFWGSGILKDTFTLTAISLYCCSFYRLFIQKSISISQVIIIIISVFIMLSVKPYAFAALLPGSILWGISSMVKKIKNALLKIALGPMVLGIGALLGVGIWMGLGQNLGRYSNLESMIEKAYESQQDLKQSYYQGNSFDIGEFEKNPTGVLSKFPEATIAGLFRPFIWEANNIQMVVSGLENMLILMFTLFFLIRVPISFIKQIVENPLVMFCIVFSLMFAFAVGLSTSNFGALVRFKIPLWPFYFSALLIINQHRIKYKLISRS